MKRGSVTLKTLEKVKDFLDHVDKPIYRAEIIKVCGVDPDSLKIVLEHLNGDYLKKIK